MGLTLKRKIYTGLVVIVAIGVVSMLIVYAGLVNLQRTVHVLADIEAPTAAYEMEINIWGQGMAVLHYLHQRDPQDRERVAKDDSDFETFYAHYVRRANTDRARALVRRLREDYDRFRSLGNSMMVRRDRQDELVVAARNNLEQIDDLIDRELQGDRSRPGAIRRLEMLLDMQTNMAALGLWVASYRRSALEVERSHAQRNIEEVEKALTSFKRAVTNHPGELPALSRLEVAFEEVIRGLAEVEAIEAQLQADSRTFSALRKQMDDVLDDEIQAEAVKDVAALGLADDRATRSVILVATLLMPAFLFAAAVVGGVLIRSVTEPVQRLIAGTGAVRQGDLSHRISPSGDSELSTLAQEFNRMVAELEGTTVSRTSLEMSQTRLREVVVELGRQTANRERAEEEGLRLQVALRRSEVLSALGSIVAGVSHEVRNPLFAISSTVDALEARAKRDREGAQYQPHVQVLRAELGRLTTLMQDLLDYGKPPSVDIAESSVAAAVRASVEACQSVATSTGATILTEIDPGIDLWPMDRVRIEQVLRNLLENAIQHSPRGTVNLDVHRTFRDGQTYLHVQVRDKGPGFDPAQLGRVFEPFFSRRNGGTGLGLSIVERIVIAHSGVVRAANHPSGGAEITVDLPRPSATNPGPEPGGAA